MTHSTQTNSAPYFPLSAQFFCLNLTLLINRDFPCLPCKSPSYGEQRKRIPGQKEKAGFTNRRVRPPATGQ